MSIKIYDKLPRILDPSTMQDAKAYILLKPASAASGDADVDSDPTFEDVTPLLLAQHESRPLQTYESFDDALDEYFSRADSAKHDATATKDKKGALTKLEKVRLDQEKRMQVLEEAQHTSASRAVLIEYNADDVDGAIEAVAQLVVSGMDWTEIGRVVKEERKKGHAIAGLIHDLNLPKNKMIMLLSHNLDDADEDELAQPALRVEIDLSLSALANAGLYYANKKKTGQKREKTVAANAKALKAAGKK